MARKLRKGKVSPLDPGKQIKKTEAAERKVARNVAKDTAPPKRKKAKAKAKAPKPRIPRILATAARAGATGLAVAGAGAAAAGGVKLISEIFSRVTSGGKPKQYQDYGWEKYSKSRARLSKAAGKQPGPVGEFSQVSERKARPKVTKKPSPGSDIMAGRGKVMTIQPKGERVFQAGYETANPKAVVKKTSAPGKKVKEKPSARKQPRTLNEAGGGSDESTNVKKVAKEAAVKKPVPAKTKPVAKKKEAVTTTKKGKPIPPRKPKSEFFSSTRKAISSARGGRGDKPTRALTSADTWKGKATGWSEKTSLAPTAPSSTRKTAQRLDFDKHNKSSKIGQKMDDSLRRFFSFMPGVLPQSTDDSKWKRK